MKCWPANHHDIRILAATLDAMLNVDPGCTRSEVDVFDLNQRVHGTFDVVLFLDVLYHLRTPLDGLGWAAAMSHDAIVETASDMPDTDEPMLRFYPSYEVSEGDATNLFAFNKAALETTLRVEDLTRFRSHYRSP